MGINSSQLKRSQEVVHLRLVLWFNCVVVKYIFSVCSFCHLFILLLIHGCKVTLVLPRITYVQGIVERSEKRKGGETFFLLVWCFSFYKRYLPQIPMYISLASSGHKEVWRRWYLQSVTMPPQMKLGVLFLRNSKKGQATKGITIMLNWLMLKFLLQVYQLMYLPHSVQQIILIFECSIYVRSLPFQAMSEYVCMSVLWHLTVIIVITIHLEIHCFFIVDCHCNCLPLNYYKCFQWVVLRLPIIIP